MSGTLANLATVLASGVESHINLPGPEGGWSKVRTILVDGVHYPLMAMVAVDGLTLPPPTITLPAITLTAAGPFAVDVPFGTLMATVDKSVPNGATRSFTAGGSVLIFDPDDNTKRRILRGQSGTLTAGDLAIGVQDVNGDAVNSPQQVTAVIVITNAPPVTLPAVTLTAAAQFFAATVPENTVLATFDVPVATGATRAFTSGGGVAKFSSDFMQVLRGPSGTLTAGTLAIATADTHPNATNSPRPASVSLNIKAVLPNLTLTPAAQSFADDVPEDTVLANINVAVPSGATRSLTAGGAIAKFNTAKTQILRGPVGTMAAGTLPLAIEDTHPNATNSPRTATANLTITSTAPVTPSAPAMTLAAGPSFQITGQPGLSVEVDISLQQAAVAPTVAQQGGTEVRPSFALTGVPGNDVELQITEV